MRTAQTALALGHVRTAFAALERLEAIHDRLGTSAAGRRDLAQLRRQASLAADLIGVPLEQVVRDANDLPHAEWRAVFQERYQGKAVILDTEVNRDASGKYTVYYLLFVAGKEARIEISDLSLLKLLPLDRPQRLILGMRLAGVERSGDGPWVVRFRPDSGVLFTHRKLVEALCPAMRSDRELGLVLERQSNWVTRFP
jgi:hypothetical protein